MKSRDDARRVTEVAIAVKSLNRMRDLGQAICVRVAQLISRRRQRALRSLHATKSRLIIVSNRVAVPEPGNKHVGSEEARLVDLRADLRPPLKLDVQFSRIQLSWMGLRSLKRRYQRDEADQLELLAPQPFRRIVLPACVPPSLCVVGPEPSHNPAIQLMEEFSDMRAAKVVSHPRTIGLIALINSPIRRGTRLFVRALIWSLIGQPTSAWE